MMCGAMPRQPLALDQRLAHQPELAIFEIAQPAMDQLGRGGRGVARQIVLLDQQHAQPAPGRIARDPDAVDAAADDQQVGIISVRARFALDRHFRLQRFATE
jgi:hypothetical protein